MEREKEIRRLEEIEKIIFEDKELREIINNTIQKLIENYVKVNSGLKKYDRMINAELNIYDRTSTKIIHLLEIKLNEKFDADFRYQLKLFLTCLIAEEFQKNVV